MALLFIFLLVFLAFRFNKERSAPVEECKHHLWMYREDNKMQCTKCQMIAGS